MTTTVTITDEEIEQAMSELNAKYPAQVPPEIEPLSRSPRLGMLADMVMLLGILTDPREVLTTQLSLCFIVGCMIGRQQATRELLDSWKQRTDS